MGEGIVVIGGGGHAKVVVSTLIDLHITIQGVYDDDPRKWGQDLCGVKIIGPLSDIDDSVEKKAIMAIGDNRMRSTIARRFERYKWMTLVHPRSFVHPTVSLGEGTVVFAGVVVQPDTVIGSHCIINTNATVDHDCVIGSYAHLGPGTCLAGGVSVGEGTFLGIGAVAIAGAVIGNWSIVGAGGAVTAKIPDNTTAVGIPAKVVKQNV